MPIARAFGYIPPMPNTGSVHQTPASLMIDTHYCQLRLVERWSWERFVRLCQFLRMTPYEVASLVMLRHDTVETYHRNGRLSGTGHRATALLLTLLEARVMAAWTEDVIARPFPDLSRSPPPLPPVGRFPGRPRKSPKSSSGCSSSGESNNGGSHEDV